MKLFKKTAALLFCLALIVGVMAVSASADDEAQLLSYNEDGSIAFEPNSGFEVMLTKSVNVSGGVNDGIISRDTVPGYEILPSNKVTFDIWAAYTGTGDNFASKTIDGFQFDFVPANNYGAVIDTNGVKIFYGTGSTNEAIITHGQSATYFTGNDATTYSYSSVGNSDNDIPSLYVSSLSYDNDTDTVTSANGTKIGTITLDFSGATRAVNIYPQIENVLFHVRNSTESPQYPSSSNNTNDNDSPATGAGTITSGGAYGNPVPNGSNSSPTSVSTSDTAIGVIKAKVPVIVNPVYDVTLKVFQNNPTTGILEDSGNTTSLKYDFLTGSFTTSDGDTPTALTNTTPTVYGYKLQGWMVTTNDQGSSTWSAWENTATWGGITSYPKLTSAMSNPAKTTAKTEQGVWSDTALTKSGTSAVAYIAVDGGTAQSPKNTTEFWPGLVGNITLTPVYTRNVYTATFNSGDNDATFNGVDNSVLGRVGGNNEDTTKAWEYTAEYTIEDLYDATQSNADDKVQDFLSLVDDVNGPNGPQGLTRTAFKFMGWTVTNDTNANSDYYWTTVKSSVNGTDDILTSKQAKRYGDVKFTAKWEEDIYFAKIDYHYANGTENSMILVGVPNDAANTRQNYNSAYTYKYDNTAMYLVPAYLNPDGSANTDGTSTTVCNQRLEYVSAAVTANDEASHDYDKDNTSDFTNAIFGTGKTYAIYAYIAPSNGADVTDITIDEGDDGNDALSYSGDIDGSNVINVGDFGNVDTLFGAPDANVFAITNPFGVKARLQADVYTDGESTSAKKFASIGDIVTIYNKMGYNITIT